MCPLLEEFHFDYFSIVIKRSKKNIEKLENSCIKPKIFRNERQKENVSNSNYKNLFRAADKDKSDALRCTSGDLGFRLLGLDGCMRAVHL